MIDNVWLLILNSVKKRGNAAVTAEAPKLHPLGTSELLEQIKKVDDTSALYTILEQSDVSDYFQKAGITLNYFQRLSQVADAQIPIELEIMRHLVYKVYYDTFINFLRSLDGNTWEAMRKLLAFELDVISIMITINMMNQQKSDKLPRLLYPRFGELYPMIHDQMQVCKDYDQLIKILDESFKDYADVLG